MKLRYNMMRRISGLSMISGVLVVLGSAGSSDAGISSISDVLRYSAIGMSLVVLGLALFLVANVLQRRYMKKVMSQRRRRICRDNFIRNMTKLEV